MPKNGYKLLVVGLSWPPETFLARLIRGLANAGVDITVATVRQPDRPWAVHPNIHWLSAPSWSAPAPVRLARLARMALAAGLRGSATLQRMNARPRRGASRVERMQEWNRLLPFAQVDCDMIYFPWNSAAIDFLPLFDLGVPVVVSCRGSQVNVAAHNPRRHSIQEGLSTTFERASAVHCVSEDIRKAAEQFGLAKDKSWIIHPAVDTEFFRPAEEHDDHDQVFRIVTTGSLVWRKGYEYALSALRLMVDHGHDVHLDIIGDGPERQRIVYTVYDLGLVGRVRLHGRLSSEQVRHWLQRADAFLLASLSEGISNAVLEAMACGLPVVTTDCGGMREAISNGVEGYVVPVRGVEAMAESLVQLALKRELGRRMGLAARQRILQQFKLHDQIERFDAMFESVLEGQLACHGSR
jgi:colanic acid/amylovoran biosynthesis glycosyltransferase